MFGLGDVAEHQGQLERANAYFREGLSLGRNAGILPDVAEALISLALVEAALGRTDDARRIRKEALSMQRRLGDAWGMAYVLNDLCQQLREDGQLEAAQATEEEALALRRESGSRMGVRAGLINPALITLERADVKRASELIGDISDGRGGSSLSAKEGHARE